MTERAIRLALIERVKKQNRNPDTKFVEELSLCTGSARIDLAVINGHIQGFEIKSADDTLRRLPAQRDVYNLVFEFVSIVATNEHIEKIRSTVPAWWGLIEAYETAGTIKLRVLRRRKRNPAFTPYAMAQLLWRNETLDALCQLGADSGLHSKPRRLLWQRLAEATSSVQLAAIVKDTLKSRQDWRAA